MSHDESENIEAMVKVSHDLIRDFVDSPVVSLLNVYRVDDQTRFELVVGVITKNGKYDIGD